MTEATYETAKNLLECRHCIGRNCRDYYMPCEVLKDMGDGRLKVRVFGYKTNLDAEGGSRIRYVESHRVYERNSQ